MSYIVLLVLVLLIYMRFEAGFLKVERVDIRTGSHELHPTAGSRNSFPAAAFLPGGLKIIFLSDLHIGFQFVSARKLRSVILKENPDVILIAGDFLEKKEELPKLAKFLKEMHLTHKTYTCFGNHDYEAFSKDRKELKRRTHVYRHVYRTEDYGRKLGKLLDLQAMEEFKAFLSRYGIIVLDNQSVKLEKDSVQYNLIGISDIRYGMQNMEKAFQKVQKGRQAINIVICHNPDMALSLNHYKADYLLSGHFHGGQIWSPFNLELKLMRKEKICKQGIIKGLHSLPHLILYISRGLGCVRLPLRFFSRPEITVINI